MVRHRPTDQVAELTERDVQVYLVAPLFAGMSVGDAGGSRPPPLAAGLASVAEKAAQTGL